jgi:hypothetical protein
MRLESKGKIADHPPVPIQGPHDHHPQGEAFRVLINGQAIGALSAWEHRIAVRSGVQTARAILRGHEPTDIQGHTGVFVIGSTVPARAICIGIKPYSTPGYPITYMGCYSRLHGDSYLTPDMFGASVFLRDFYIDDDEVVIEFYNPGVTGQIVSCYGLVEVK